MASNPSQSQSTSTADTTAAALAAIPAAAATATTGSAFDPQGRLQPTDPEPQDLDSSRPSNGLGSGLGQREVRPGSSSAPGETSKGTSSTPGQSSYTFDHLPATLRAHSLRDASTCAQSLIPLLGSAPRILDIGCGPGSITVSLAALRPQGHVTGLEISEAPLAEARQLAKAAKVTNVDWVIGDSHALAYPDGSFDVAYCHQVLVHDPRPVDTLREMRRVVKPGGLVVCREVLSLHAYPLVPGLEHGLQTPRRMAEDHGPGVVIGGQLHVYAQRAGFTRSEIKLGTGIFSISTPDKCRLYADAMAARLQPGTDMYNNLLKGGYMTAQQAREAAHGWVNWAKDPDAWHLMVSGEILCRKGGSWTST